MKHEFIIQTHQPRILLFFAGWASDPTPFKDYRPEKTDYVICYDYRTLQHTLPSLEEYQEFIVVGWSMGVWAASHVAPSLGVPVTHSIAINGTPFPIHAQWGIPPAIWQGTLDNLSPLSLHKFTRRMCIDSGAFHRFLRVTPHRPIEELAEEMRAVTRLQETLPAPHFAWQDAVIGQQDRIIPPANQQNAWRQLDVPIHLNETAHYDEPTFKHFLQDLWTNKK